MNPCFSTGFLDKNASSSRLINIISRLYTLQNQAVFGHYQQRLETHRIRYNVCSPEGRFELIADLISEQRETLTSAETRALQKIAADLTDRTSDNNGLLGYATDYLSTSIREALAHRPPTAQPSGGSARNLLVALSLSGVFASGCGQQSGANTTLLPSIPATAIAATRHVETIPAPINRAARETAISKTAPAQQPLQTYCVSKGDSVRSIAERFGINYRELARHNRIHYDRHRDWFVLYPGQKIELPGTFTPAPSAARTATPVTPIDFLSVSRRTPPDGFSLYLVKKGDVLSTIAEHFDVPTKKIMTINKIRNPRRLRYGVMLKIPVTGQADTSTAKPFKQMNRAEKIAFLKERTIRAGHPYLEKLVAVSEEYKIDPRLYASLIWEESWFNANARSQDNCMKLAQLDPRFHKVSKSNEDNFRKSLGYLRHEFIYYRNKGFDTRSAALCALAAYNGGNTRIRKYIRNGTWDGRNISTIPLKETRDYLKKICRRLETNYQAVL